MGYTPRKTTDVANEAIHNDMVTPEARRFAELVAKKLNAKWSRKRNTSTWIYRENEVYALGFVGYGSFTEKTSSENHYIVHSHNITNNRYNDYNAQHYMAFAKHLDKGVENAMRYLRAVPFHMSVETERKRLRDKMHEINTDRHRQVRELSREITKELDHEFSSSALERELRNLVNTNHTWLDAQFGEQINKFLAYKDEDNTAGVPLFDAVYINISPRGKQTVSVHPDLDTRPWSWSAQLDTCYHCEFDELDDELQRKIFTLQMVEQGAFVPNVGMHAIQGRLFYVTRTNG